MTLPQVDSLAAFWTSVPPPAIQLKRIALALGLPDTKPALDNKYSRRSATSESPDDAIKQAMAMGIPVMRGRPDDPLLELIGL